VGRFAEAWLLPNSFRSALAPRLAGIPERIGYDTDRRRPLLTHALPPPRRTGHQLRDYDALLRSRGIEPDLEPPRLPVTAKALDRAASALEAAGVDRDEPLALLAPGAAFGWTKRWPPDHFAVTGRTRLWDKQSAPVRALGVVIGPGEEAWAGPPPRAALPVLGADLIRWSSPRSFSCARFVVSNDSGPMHSPRRSAFRSRPSSVRRLGRTAPSAPLEDSRPLCLLLALLPKECPLGTNAGKRYGGAALEAVKELLS
jgi:heptosyltransferase-2